MEYKDKKLLLTPTNKAHVTGQPYPKKTFIIEKGVMAYQK